jgi:hypothetical protein
MSERGRVLLWRRSRHRVQGGAATRPGGRRLLACRRPIAACAGSPSCLGCSLSRRPRAAAGSPPRTRSARAGRATSSPRRRTCPQGSPAVAGPALSYAPRVDRLLACRGRHRGRPGRGRGRAVVRGRRHRRRVRRARARRVRGGAAAGRGGGVDGRALRVGRSSYVPVHVGGLLHGRGARVVAGLERRDRVGARASSASRRASSASRRAAAAASSSCLPRANGAAPACDVARWTAKTRRHP